MAKKIKYHPSTRVRFSVSFICNQLAMPEYPPDRETLVKELRDRMQEVIIDEFKLPSGLKREILLELLDEPELFEP